MKAKFGYQPLPEMVKLIESIENTGYQFFPEETSGVMDEGTLNSHVESVIIHLEMGYQEIIDGLQKQHYNSRSVGPYAPYPNTSKP
jgi:K+ transporter